MSHVDMKHPLKPLILYSDSETSGKPALPPAADPTLIRVEQRQAARVRALAKDDAAYARARATAAQRGEDLPPPRRLRDPIFQLQRTGRLTAEQVAAAHDIRALFHGEQHEGIGSLSDPERLMMAGVQVSKAPGGKLAWLSDRWRYHRWMAACSEPVQKGDDYGPMLRDLALLMLIDHWPGKRIDRQQGWRNNTAVAALVRALDLFIECAS